MMEAAHYAALEQRPEAFESLYAQGRTRSHLALVSRASAKGCAGIGGTSKPANLENIRIQSTERSADRHV
jgi:hypothetical protein